ncbi:hypothetical protein [Streptomyces sp. NPDC047070]|uniref:hypothetical protein n=1 Tax=unclassified Streptomyces TaxID=2593676 RepID=UPI00345217D6
MPGDRWRDKYFERRWGEDDHGLFAEISADTDLHARLSPVFRNITMDQALTELANWRRQYHRNF